MRKEALLACQASFFQKLHEIVPDLPTQVAGAVLRLVTVNPATKALEQLDLLKTYMQLRFVILLSHERAHVITYGYVAKVT